MFDINEYINECLQSLNLDFCMPNSSLTKGLTNQFDHQTTSLRKTENDFIIITNLLPNLRYYNKSVT